MWETITSKGGVDLQWVENDHGDGSGFTLQRVGSVIYIDVYADQDDVAAERIDRSLVTDVETLRAALNEA